MNRRLTFGMIGLCALLLGFQEAASFPSNSGEAAARPTARPSWGVCLCGPEFGTEKPGFSNEAAGVCGRDYTYNSERSVQYFCDKGAKLLRVPIRWERVQPRLGESLDQMEMARLQVLLGWAGKHGGEVIIDLHNYGRYTCIQEGRPRACVIDQKRNGETPVSRQHFADLWRRLAQAFRDQPAIRAYGLMNEPHDMGASDWRQISQTAVDAIRATGDTRLILVAGNEWSKAHRFAAANGVTAWIHDPAGNVAYEAHCYFDRDGSGRYEKSYDAEEAIDSRLEERGEERLRTFSAWCEKNRVRGFIGEYAVPAGDSRWLRCLDKFQAAMRRANMEGCYWAGGEWWGNHSLSIQPSHGFTRDAPAVQILMK